MSVSLDTAVRPVTVTELEQARLGDPEGHGLAVLTVTVDGSILAVCACAIAAYGSTEDEAREHLTRAHP